MKKFFWLRVICVAASMLVLAACSNQTGVASLLLPQEDEQTSADDFEGVLKTNWNSYLISVGGGLCSDDD